MLESLIGAQITEVGSDFINISLNDKEYKLEITSDEGGCCGYADFETLVFDNQDKSRNPIITKIDVTNEDDSYGDKATITFYGESAEIAAIQGEAGSGSGWNYGACVTITCNALNINEDLVSW